ncbi:hypothetical protein AHAS_Ahas15G0161100 [Arachis hypogaea]
MAGKPINQAGAVSGKAKKCGAGGGRKPLGDLSNAGKPINQAGGKKALHVSVDSRLLTQERNLKGAVSGKAKKCGKKALDVSINRHSEKSVTARRKALSDISNSVVEPPPLDFDVFEELGMLHDHSKCIKYMLSNFSPLGEAELLSEESESPHIEVEEEEEDYNLQEVTEPEIYMRCYRPVSPMNSPECRKMLHELKALYSERPDARQ